MGHQHQMFGLIIEVPVDMKLYTYIVARDYGFAPNPFHGYCTLATCKPRIRSVAKIDDWVIGVGAVGADTQGKLIYAMKVTEALSFNEYWNDERFQAKKPEMNGSLMQAYGDNIYHFDEESEEWHQKDSHHSHKNGSVNEANLKKDTQADRVLISDHFYYFGKSSPHLPKRLLKHVCQGQNHKNIDELELMKEFLNWIENVGELNVLTGFPDDLEPGEFEVYKGQ